MTLKTLKRLASAFEVGLMVKFVPFSELVESELHLTPDSLKVRSFDEEPYFREEQKGEANAPLIKKLIKEYDNQSRINELMTRLPTKPIDQALEFRQKEIKTPLRGLMSGGEIH